MGREQRYGFYMGFMIGVLIGLVLLSMGGCSTTTLSRDDEGELGVRHTTWFIKTEAPSLDVTRDGVNEYTAHFNAKSRGGDIEALAVIISTLVKALAPVPVPVTKGDDQ